MKLKIFNKAVLTLICVAAANAIFAQQRSDSVKDAVAALPAMPLQVQAFSGAYGEPMTMNLFSPQDTAYRKEYRKLQEQMGELRKKMSKLQSEEMHKNSEKMRELARSNVNKSFDNLERLSYSYNDNVSGESKGLGITSNTRSFYYNGGKGDDYLKKKIASGEVKEKTKSYTKTYSIDKDDKISVDNSFGKVVVNTWAKNEVRVDVEIKADADDDAAAQKLLDGVNISDSKSGSVVSFKTSINQDSDGMHFHSHNEVNKTEVNYTVYMPAKSSLILNNRFGSVKIPDLSGKLMLNLSYGTLNAQQLTNPLNELTVRFGDANIESLNSTAMNISYGKLNIGTADNLKAKLSFSSGNVDKLRSSGDISVKYGAGFKVGQLTNVKNLNVDASFTKVLVNVKDDYDFDVNTKMGSFNYDNNGAVKVLTTSPENEHGYSSTKFYKGKVGKGNADKTITIKSTYGSVKFDDEK